MKPPTFTGNYKATILVDGHEVEQFAHYSVESGWCCGVPIRWRAVHYEPVFIGKVWKFVKY